jgi:hypothetical protein
MVKSENISKEQAVQFLEEVSQRAKGNLPDSIAATLLSANPRFSKNSELEMFEGWKQTFRTKAHPKAKGADISISFPRSWSSREGNRPNILQFYQSGAGHGDIMATILIKSLPLPENYKLTEADLKEIFQPSALKEMIPTGGSFVEAKRMVLDGNPAGFLVFDKIQSRLDFTIEMRSTQFLFVHDNNLITLQFMCSKPKESKHSLEEIFKQQLPTYRAVANTVVFDAQYK